MIFETLHESSQRGELMLVDGGMCHWHLRRDGQLTIREIISTRPGAGSQMLRRLEATPGATSLLAKCPAGMDANVWYTRRGFHVERTEWTKSGRMLLVWRKMLSNEHRRPNAGMVEVIYCAGKNAAMSDIACDAEMLLGTRGGDTVTHRPYFTDQNWQAPCFDAYEALLAEYCPHIATVLDWERRAQLPEVLRWAEMAAQYAQVVVIIPKVIGGVAQLPKVIGGKPVRIGYSVPTTHAGPYDVEMYNTIVPLAEFAAWDGPGGVHLLGGSPHVQMHIYRQIGNVRSVDGNMHLKCANEKVQFWAWPPVASARNRYFVQLQEAGGSAYTSAANAEAFRRSCINIMAAWRAVVSESREPAQVTSQMHLWPEMAG